LVNSNIKLTFSHANTCAWRWTGTTFIVVELLEIHDYQDNFPYLTLFDIFAENFRQLYLFKTNNNAVFWPGIFWNSYWIFAVSLQQFQNFFFLRFRHYFLIFRCFQIGFLLQLNFQGINFFLFGQVKLFYQNLIRLL
jgi:hypothetical protein